MVAFVILGALCGLLAACFVCFHRSLVEWERQLAQPGRPLAFLQRSRYLYPLIVAFLIATMTFPYTVGPFMGLVQREEINQLLTREPLHCLQAWSHLHVLLCLILFVVLKFVLSAIAITLPVPAGVFVPVFVIGAGFGRFVGELMVIMFPHGLLGAQSDGDGRLFDSHASCTWASPNHIVPGGYAVVGAAAFAASVTHTISTSVIVFELTGQIQHILPVMVAVLVGNAVCQSLSPSIYDSIIQLRGIPYLPDLRRGLAYAQTAETIMRRELFCVSLNCSYAKLSRLLKSSSLLHFPLVDDLSSMVLIGSVHRQVLAALLAEQLSVDVPDASSNEAREQRRERLRRTIDLTGVPIDPSPFQLVAQSSLYKIHTLFSTLGVSTAYVTNMGRLVGVIGMAEVRQAVISSSRRRLEGRDDIRAHPRALVHFAGSVDRDEDGVEVADSSALSEPRT